jgi:hypothetical protein
MTGVRFLFRMIEDMAARKLNPHTQRSHVYSCKRFAAWLKRSPDTFYPVSAVLSNNEILGVLKPGEHGSTFGGNAYSPHR